MWNTINYEDKPKAPSMTAGLVDSYHDDSDDDLMDLYPPTSIVSPKGSVYRDNDPASCIPLEEEAEVAENHSAYLCKKACVREEVDAALTRLLEHLDAETRQSLLQSSALFITALRGGPPSEPESVTGLRGGSGGSTSSSSSDGNFPALQALRSSLPRNLRELLENVPVELMMNLQAYIPPVDELQLCRTHPALFHSDKFSFLREDANYQKQWQNGSAQQTVERLPLLHHAISTNAPLWQIQDILWTWQAEGMDVDNAWTQNTARVRADPAFVSPLFAAVDYGRFDVMEELLDNWEADPRGIDQRILGTPLTVHARREFDEATWEKMEELVLEVHRRRGVAAAPFISVTGVDRVRVFEACVKAGWLRLLRLAVDPLVDTNHRPPMLFNPGVWTRHRTVQSLVTSGLRVVGDIRVDATETIEYLLSLRSTLEQLGHPVVLSPQWDWSFLHRLIMGTPNQPKRHRNATLLIQRVFMTTGFFSRGLNLSDAALLDACADSDDNLELTMALYNANKTAPAPVPNPYTESTVRRIEAVNTYALICAVGSRQGAPKTVRWLVEQESVPLALRDPALATAYPNYAWKSALPQGQPAHALQALVGAPSPDVLRANMAALFARAHPDQVLDDWYGQRPVDVLSTHDGLFVELVAYTAANPALAAGWVRQAALERRAERLRLNQLVSTIRTEGMSLQQIMRVEQLTYETRRRILDWCLVNGVYNELPAVLEGV